MIHLKKIILFYVFLKKFNIIDVVYYIITYIYFYNDNNNNKQFLNKLLVFYGIK